MTNVIQSDSLSSVSTHIEDDCSLPPADFPGRLAMIRDEIAPFAKGMRKLENGIAWDFEATDPIRARLEKLARLERECCGHLEFEIWENPNGTRLRFEILGADPDSGYFDGLAAIQTTADDKPRERWLRFGRRGALAAGASFFVCCVIPAALVTFAGTKIAAPLIKLDHPLVIAAGTILFTSLFWFWERRRLATTSPAAGDSELVGRCGC